MYNFSCNFYDLTLNIAIFEIEQTAEEYFFCLLLGKHTCEFLIYCINCIKSLKFILNYSC